MSSSSSVCTENCLCNPVFPYGTNADTHYRDRDYICGESACDCPVHERTVQTPTSKSYGTVFVQDGNAKEEQHSKDSNSFVRYYDNTKPLGPKLIQKRSSLKSFTVDLHYFDYKYSFNKKRQPSASNLLIEYSKEYRRISSGKNVVEDVTRSISQYSGCYEAKKLRKRLIALGRIHNTISEQTFKFPINHQ